MAFTVGYPQFAAIPQDMARLGSDAKGV